jgi:hypothetical protein
MSSMLLTAEIFFIFELNFKETPELKTFSLNLEIQCCIVLGKHFRASWFQKYSL